MFPRGARWLTGWRERGQISDRTEQWMQAVQSLWGTKVLSPLGLNVPRLLDLVLDEGMRSACGEGVVGRRALMTLLAGRDGSVWAQCEDARGGPQRLRQRGLLPDAHPAPASVGRSPCGFALNPHRQWRESRRQDTGREESGPEPCGFIPGSS